MIKLIVFDLSGTTVQDDNAVAQCLYQGASKFGIQASLDDFQKTIGTNKIKLYEFMIARDHGQDVLIEDLEKYDFPEYHSMALEVFHYYSHLMVSYYKNEVRPMPGAEETFKWCHQNGILVATDTGFHDDVNTAIMEGLQWTQNGLVDISIDVEDTNEVGRPTPFMIYHAMFKLDVQNIHQVIKIGDTPADLLSGYNAGCIGNIGVLSGANSFDILSHYPHTHIIESIANLPRLIHEQFS